MDLKRRYFLFCLCIMLIPWAALKAEPGVCPLNDESDPAQASLWETVTSKVKIKQALMITYKDVVNDRTRTYDLCDTANKGTKNGAWTFGYIMRKLAGSQDVSTFTLNWLNTWATTATVNTFQANARPNIQNVISTWPKLTNGNLDLDQAPFRLAAIVNRVDLAGGDTIYGTSGEGRFIFNYYSPTNCNNVQQFNVIFEFKLPQKFSTNVATNTKQWAGYWNQLSSFSGFTAEYRAKLQEITNSFVAAGNLGQLRTNEIALATDGTWELREFKLLSNALKLVGTSNTPDNSKNNTQDLVTFLNTNAAGIVAGTVAPPNSWLGGRSTANNNTNGAWGFGVASQIQDLDARHVFALNTCNGCHTTESGTCFTHVMPRKATSESGISNFLKGVNIDDFDFHMPVDPVAIESMQFNELDCRALDSYDLIMGTTNGGLRTSAPITVQPVPGETARGMPWRVPRNTVH